MNTVGHVFFETQAYFDNPTNWLWGAQFSQRMGVMHNIFLHVSSSEQYKKSIFHIFGRNMCNVIERISENVIVDTYVFTLRSCLLVLGQGHQGQSRQPR